MTELKGTYLSVSSEEPLDLTVCLTDLTPSAQTCRQLRDL